MLLISSDRSYKRKQRRAEPELYPSSSSSSSSLFFLPYDGKSVCSKARILVGTLLPRTGVSSRSDDTWLLEGNSSIVQRIVAKILKSPEKPMISRLLEILSLDSLLTIHPGILHCCFQRSTNLPIGEPLCTCSPSNR